MTGGICRLKKLEEFHLVNLDKPSRADRYVGAAHLKHRGHYRWKLGYVNCLNPTRTFNRTMNCEMSTTTFRDHLVELLRGGFAPVVILLREFHFDKAGIVLDGLPFSAYSLLEHMRHRQGVLLHFMKNPQGNSDTWPDAYWPDNPVPQSEEVWLQAIATFEQELEEMIQLVKHPETDFFQSDEHGKTICWAAMTTFHHNAYTIGQIKAVGRQLGVW